MSIEFAAKCIEKALSMQEKVKKNFNSLHDINFLFDFSLKTDAKRTKKSTRFLKKEGFDLLSDFGFLKQSAGKCTKC